MMSPPKSDVWKYFEVPAKGERVATCKTCLKDLKTSGNTTNLVAHLKQKHPALFSQLKLVPARELR